MLETKLDLIEESAKLYGQDNMSYINSNGGSIRIDIEDLLDEGYLTKDKDDEKAGYIVNPVDNSSLNSWDVYIYIKHKRVVAEVVR